MVRVDGALQPVDWEVALTAAAEGLAEGSARPRRRQPRVSCLADGHRGGDVSARANCARPRQRQYRSSPAAAGFSRAGNAIRAFPNLGLKIADVEMLEGVLVIGSNLRHEMPMLAHRIRKAAVQRGAKVAFLNPREFDYLFPVAATASPRISWENWRRWCGPRRRRPDKPVPAGVRGSGGERCASRARGGAGPAQRRAIIPGSARAAPPRLLGDSSALAAASRGACRREPRTHHRGRQCRGCVPRGRSAASRTGRHAGRRGRACRHAPCWRTGSRPMCCSAESIRRPIWRAATEALAARRPGHRGDDAPDREAARRGTCGAADRHLRRKLRHVRECRGTLAKLGRRGEAVGREPAGLESAARARQPAEHPRRRLRELGGSSRGAEESRAARG